MKQSQFQLKGSWQVKAHDISIFLQEGGFNGGFYMVTPFGFAF
jgi:hypothetical protein